MTVTFLHILPHIFQKYYFKLLYYAYYCIILAAQHAVICTTMPSLLVELIANKTNYCNGATSKLITVADYSSSLQIHFPCGNWLLNTVKEFIS